MPIGKPIAELGDTGDADNKIAGFSLPSGLGGPAAVTPSFGAAATSAPTTQAAPSGYAPDRTAGAAEAVKGGAESTIEHSKESTDWINNKWRPVMGWMYMLVCTCDFVLFPILWSVLQAVQGGQVTNQWQPLSLQGAGLFHIAMGAVLGVAAYGRTKEKLESKQ
jgi:hypothetical protein